MELLFLGHPVSVYGQYIILLMNCHQIPDSIGKTGYLEDYGSVPKSHTFKPFFNHLLCHSKHYFIKEQHLNGTPVKKVTVRCLLLCGSFDAPAKCLFQSLVQFNGKFGCPYCLEPGITVKTSERGHTHTYPFNTENLKTGHAEKRTHKQTLELAKIASDRIVTTGVAKTEKGVRGFSWFVCVPGFDIIRGVAIDYMHSVLLGVDKMLFNLWLDKQHHGNAWYIGKSAK